MFDLDDQDGLENLHYQYASENGMVPIILSLKENINIDKFIKIIQTRVQYMLQKTENQIKNKEIQQEIQNNLISTKPLPPPRNTEKYAQKSQFKSDSSDSDSDSQQELNNLNQEQLNQKPDQNQYKKNSINDSNIDTNNNFLDYSLEINSEIKSVDQIFENLKQKSNQKQLLTQNQQKIKDIIEIKLQEQIIQLVQQQKFQFQNEENERDNRNEQTGILKLYQENQDNEFYSYKINLQDNEDDITNNILHDNDDINKDEFNLIKDQVIELKLKLDESVQNQDDNDQQEINQPQSKKNPILHKLVLNSSQLNKSNSKSFVNSFQNQQNSYTQENSQCYDNQVNITKNNNQDLNNSQNKIIQTNFKFPHCTVNINFKQGDNLEGIAFQAAQKNQLTYEQFNKLKDALIQVQQQYFLVQTNTQYPNPSQLNSFGNSLALILKAGMGMGILASPYIFKQCGLILAPILILFCGLICYWAFNTTLDLLDYSDRWNQRIKLFDAINLHLGDKVSDLLKVTNMFYNFGITVIYLMLILENLITSLNLQNTVSNKILICLVLGIIYMPLSVTRNLAYTTKYAQLGIFLQFSIVFLLIINSLQVYYSNIKEQYEEKENDNLYETLFLNDYNMIQFQQIFLNIGLILYTFDVSNVYSDLRNSMRNISQTRKVLKYYFIIMYLIQVILGSTAYLAYGSDTNELIFKNTSKTGFLAPLSLLINNAYVLCLILTINFANYTFSMLAEKYMGIKENEPQKQIMIRLNLYFSQTFVAIFAPSLTVIMNFLGSFCVILIMFIFPYMGIRIMFRQHNFMLRKRNTYLSVCLIGISIGICALLHQFVQIFL
ncbi:hypothetical protein PPERSA_01903 [Pseudocohnilembus persalinus]|uniref:Amino acid transporter transmembrane domain-containing protein n=1 Tax=Pseudocohnilembus persalinus TaxID=266149 RepID=A0A0V0R469_PSEPJ|nr:hypothetical protein PPERSA_01903 [Pseudocohnilembus persalinus]|eukprot:KRX09016.1 hypothetical protein PPERSA_01903 [Pseudocohnilembus persalinus]